MSTDDIEALRGLTRNLFSHGTEPEETPPPPLASEGNVAPREGHGTTAPPDPMASFVAALFRDAQVD